jgi:exodeoxyribonuclease-3
MKLASWNVNSLKVRLPQLIGWLALHRPDIVCLQETKLEDDKFPILEIEAAGYRCAWSGQKTYNGVAILSRAALGDIVAGMPAFPDEQKRVIAASVGHGADAVRVVCVYVPNGQALGSEKYEYKLRWLAACRSWLAQELSRNPRLAVLGDYNVAPADEDVYDPKAWQGQVLCSAPEREAFRNLLALGLKDSFRLFPQKEKSHERIQAQFRPANRSCAIEFRARFALQCLCDRRGAAPGRATIGSCAGHGRPRDLVAIIR